jgi:hypothetical protein
MLSGDEVAKAPGKKGQKRKLADPALGAADAPPESPHAQARRPRGDGAQSGGFSARRARAPRCAARA